MACLNIILNNELMSNLSIYFINYSIGEQIDSFIFNLKILCVDISPSLL